MPLRPAPNGDDEPVYTVIRRYTLDSPTSQVRAALQRGYIEDACKAPGFIAYFAVEDEDGDFATVAVFRSQEDFENFATAEANWIAQNLGDLLPAPDEALSGDTYVYAGAAQMFRNTCPGAPQPTAGPAPTTAPGAPTATAAPTAVPATPTPTPGRARVRGASARPGRGGHVTGDSSAARPPMSRVVLASARRGRSATRTSVLRTAAPVTPAVERTMPAQAAAPTTAMTAGNALMRPLPPARRRLRLHDRNPVSL